MLVALSPASSKAISTRRRNSSAATPCMRAGISSVKSSNKRSGISAALARLRCAVEPTLAAGLGERAHAADISGALGHRDDAARIEQIEAMACLDALVIGRQRQLRLEQRAALGLGIAEMRKEALGIRALEIEGGEFALAALEHIAVFDAGAVEVEVIDILDALHVHGQPLEPVGQLGRDRIAFDAADLLEIGELRHLHAIEPDFPAEPPRAERRALPIILDEADVVAPRIDAERIEAFEIERLAIGRRRLQDDLELVIVLQPVGILAITPVGRPARGLHISGAPGIGPERAQGRRRMKGPRPHLDIIGLENHATLIGPEFLQRKDERLEAIARRSTRRHPAIQEKLRLRRKISADSGRVKPPRSIAPGTARLAAIGRALRRDEGTALRTFDEILDRPAGRLWASGGLTPRDLLAQVAANSLDPCLILERVPDDGDEAGKDEQLPEAEAEHRGSAFRRDALHRPDDAALQPVALDLMVAVMEAHLQLLAAATAGPAFAIELAIARFRIGLGGTTIGRL